ncbi:MAG TPA: IclR family transcriptional regulator [Gaiellaceae bacterium]
MNTATASLARGLDVLETLGRPEHAAGLGVVALAELVGGDKSQVSRALSVLADHGFVTHAADGRSYRLGCRLFALAAAVGEARLLAEAPPILRGLVRELGESAHLSVRQGGEVLTLLTESPPATLHAPGRVGSLTPLATTSAGRALVLDLGDEELAALGLGAHADAVARSRERGYVVVREEFEPGLVAAAAPVRDGAGRIVAALNVSAPGFRFEKRLDAAGARVAAAAEELRASAWS